MAPTSAQPKWRSGWRGERTPMLVRLSDDTAERLVEEAQQHCSLSETAARLIADGLWRGAA